MSWNIDSPAAEYFDHNTPGLSSLIQEVQATQEIAIDTETTGLINWKDVPLYWSLAWGGRRVTLNVSAIHKFREVFADENKRWLMANAKYDTHILANAGFTLAGKLVDVQVMHSLLYEERSHALKEMHQHLFNWKWQDFQDSFGKITEKNTSEMIIRKVESENFPLLCEYSANDSWGTLRCYKELSRQLKNAPTYSLFRGHPLYIETLWDLFDRVEVPYTKALWQTERNGILVDQEYLQRIAPDAVAEIEDLEKEICKTAGKVFNPASPAQLADYFFNKLQVKPTKWTKGGVTGVKKPSVDVSFLEHYADSVPMAALVLRHRELKKLHGTYIVGLQEHIDPTGRIHPTYNQDVTRTGRVSCVAAWTPVKTKQGSKSIFEVEIGDYVWTHKNRWRRVQNRFTRSADHMYDIRFSTGEILTCTIYHKLLSSTGQWITVGELLNEYLQSVGSRSSKAESSTGSIQVERVLNSNEDSRETKDYFSQCLSHTCALHARGREESTPEGKILSLKNWYQEPYEGEERNQTSQLEGGVRRWQGIPNHKVQREEVFCTPCGVNESLGYSENTQRHGSASYRQQSEEQQYRQLGSSNQIRTQVNTLLSGQGLTSIKVEEINYRGSFEVYDITVEEDESYFGCGVYSHNCKEPNLQTIPRPEGDKWKLRGAFIAGKGKKLLVGDYEQLEMRILACASLEPGMIEVINKGWDIHMGNAAMIFGIPYEEVLQAKKIEKKVGTKELPASALTARVKECLMARTSAKTLGFGLIYGMGPNKLANALGISLVEAEAKVLQFEKAYPAAKQFKDEVVAQALRTGYTFTILGRRRNVPEIASHNRLERMRGERVALNTEIQGSAADVVKMAQVLLHKARLDRRYDAQAILQVHDELVHECPNEAADRAMTEIVEWMEHPFPIDLATQLTVSINKGDNWLQAK